MSQSPPARSKLKPATHKKSSIAPPPVAAIRVIVWEQNKKIASPILQERLGGNKSAPHLFDEVFWQHDTSLIEKPKMKNLTKEQLRLIANHWQQELDKMLAAQNHEKFNKPKERFSNNPFRGLKK